MKTVWKYPVMLGPNVLRMPEGASVLRFAPQDGAFYVWALVEDGRPMADRKVVVCGTGHHVYDGMAYVGSISEPPYEWHCFAQEGS